jgi:hypothetical protein
MAKHIIIDDKERVSAWVAERIPNCSPWDSVYEAIGLEQGGELIAGVVYDGYVEGARVNMHVAGVGKRWLNREFLSVCFRYPFVQLGVNVVIGLVESTNEAALKFDKHLGFTEACRIAGGAKNCDLIVLTMQRKTCRFLGI